MQWLIQRANGRGPECLCLCGGEGAKEMVVVEWKGEITIGDRPMGCLVFLWGVTSRLQALALPFPSAQRMRNEDRSLRRAADNFRGPIIYMAQISTQLTPVADDLHTHCISDSSQSPVRLHRRPCPTPPFVFVTSVNTRRSKAQQPLHVCSRATRRHAICDAEQRNQSDHSIGERRGTAERQVR